MGFHVKSINNISKVNVKIVDQNSTSRKSLMVMQCCAQVLIRGRHVFMGYLGMEEKTKETIDDEGWLHSGDIGRFDQVGCVEEGMLVMQCTLHRMVSYTLLVVLRVRSGCICTITV